ncbi:hypothetical protein [Pseudomonas azotoformans]
MSSESSFTSLIKPARYWTHWSFDAQDMHGICQDQLHQQGDPADVVARHMNQLFSGQVLCSDSPQDGFWLDVLYEAADLMPTFELKPLEVFVGREAASKIYCLLPTTTHHAPSRSRRRNRFDERLPRFLSNLSHRIGG